jgi:5'-nucleotidase
LQILPFENPIVMMQVSGKTIKEALEHGVAEVGVRVSGRFPQVSGLKFSYDARQPVGSRVTEVTVGGQPLDESKLYRLTTNNFLAEGGDGYLMLKSQKRLLNAQEGNSESVALLNHIQKLKVIAPRVEGRIKRLDQAAL